MLITADNETHLIRPANQAPKMVCVTISEASDHADIIRRRDPAAKREVRNLLENPRVKVGGSNLPFDLAVWVAEWPEFLPLVFELLESVRMHDVQVRQKLLDIAMGTYRFEYDAETDTNIKNDYNLAGIAKRWKYPVDLDKDTWRLRFSELEDLPVVEWPEDAQFYCKHDVWAPRWVIERQSESLVESEQTALLADQFRRQRAHWALTLISAWGVRTDPVMVKRYRERIQALLDSHRDLLLEKGFIVPKKGGGYKKEVKKILAYAEETLENPKRTAKGRISLSEDSVAEYGDPVLTAFQEFGAGGTAMNRVEEWEQGLWLPIHTRFDELMASGRTSSSKPNIQARYAGNNPTEPKFGDRECMVPRKGNVFLICDVPGLELATIAQKCIEIVGYSKLAEDLNEGNDPHARVAALLLALEYEEVVRRKEDPNDEEVYLARQTGKVVNFGRDAGAGAKTIKLQAKQKYGLDMTLDDAKRAIDAHGKAYPEVLDFHKWVTTLARGGYATIIHLYSDRVRADCRFTEAANSFSQGLGADATLAALYELVKACYIGPGPLLGSRVANYVHDEFITETRECDLDAKATQMGDVLTDELNKWLPDVPIKRKKMQPYAARRWSKLAHRVTNPDGSLGVWEWDEAIRLGSKGHAD